MRFMALAVTLLALCGPQAMAAHDSPGSSAPAGTSADATAAQVALIPWASIIKDETGTKTVGEAIRAALTEHAARTDHYLFSRLQHGCLLVQAISSAKAPRPTPQRLRQSYLG